MEIMPIGCRKVLLAFAILCLASLACLAPALATPGDYVKQYGGDINIYTRILEMKDCTELQREVEWANENSRLHAEGTQAYQAFIGYRTAAQNRIREVECTGAL